MRSCARDDGEIVDVPGVVRNGKMGISCLITGSFMLRIYEPASRSRKHSRSGRTDSS